MSIAVPIGTIVSQPTEMVVSDKASGVAEEKDDKGHLQKRPWYRVKFAGLGWEYKWSCDESQFARVPPVNTPVAIVFAFSQRREAAQGTRSLYVAEKYVSEILSVSPLRSSDETPTPRSASRSS